MDHKKIKKSLKELRGLCEDNTSRDRDFIRSIRNDLMRISSKISNYPHPVNSDIGHGFENAIRLIDQARQELTDVQP